MPNNAFSGNVLGRSIRMDSTEKGIQGHEISVNDTIMKTMNNLDRCQSDFSPISTSWSFLSKFLYNSGNRCCSSKPPDTRIHTSLRICTTWNSKYGLNINCRCGTNSKPQVSSFTWNPFPDIPLQFYRLCGIESFACVFPFFTAPYQRFIVVRGYFFIGCIIKSTRPFESIFI